MKHYRNQRILNQFGKRLKDLREEADISHELIQKGTGISSSHLSQIENGKHNFRVGYIALFAEFYGLEDFELLDYSNPIPKGDELRKGITKYLKQNGIDPTLVLKRSITTILEKEILPLRYLTVARTAKEISEYILEKYKVEFTTTVISRTLGILVDKNLILKLPTDKKSKFQYRKNANNKH